MSLVCALTGEVPEEGVFCAETGLIYERRLIQKHLAARGCCPVTGVQLKADQLVPIKQNAAIKPRPVTSASIPGLLATLQNEWDALMSEAFTLKTHLDKTRQQLAHALYQQDAATRVIARLLREKEAAQQQLQSQQHLLLQLQRSVVAEAGAAEGEVGISEELASRMQSLAKELLAARKKRQVYAFFGAKAAKTALESGESVSAASAAASAAGSAEASAFRCSMSLPLHSASQPGVLRVSPESNAKRLASIQRQRAQSAEAEGKESEAEGSSDLTERQLISVSAGVDGSIVFFDCRAQRQLEKLRAHGKACRDFLLHKEEPLLVTGGDDKLLKSGEEVVFQDLKVWRGSLDFSRPYTSVYSLRGQKAPVVSLSLHPLGDIFASAAADRSWALVDLREGKYLRIARDAPSEYKALRFHPDGMIVGCASVSGEVFVWDVRSFEQRAALPLPKDGASLTSLAFSENGYYMATASTDSTVQLWDLRKSLVFETLSVSREGVANAANASCTNVCFDESGLSLAACSSLGFVALFNFEGRAHATQVGILEGHSGAVMDAQFVEDAHALLTASKDKTVRVWEMDSQARV